MYCFARDRHQCRGLTIYSGLEGAIIGIFQIVIYAGVSPELVWIVIGGILNFISGLPIYLSFKKEFFMEYNSSWGNEVVFALSTNKAKRKTATLNGRVNAHLLI